MSSHKKCMEVYLGKELKKKTKAKAALEGISVSEKFREVAEDWAGDIDVSEE